MNLKAEKIIDVEKFTNSGDQNGKRIHFMDIVAK
jgi:hypothetical protein